MKKRILCYGDSNTYGYNPINGERYGENERWPGVLSEELGEGYTVIEEGLSGRTTVFDDPLNEGLSGLTYIHPCLMSHAPLDLLIIMLGTNDTKERFAVNAEVITLGLTRLVNKAKNTAVWSNNTPNILIIAPVPIEKEYYNIDSGIAMGVGCSEKSYGLSPLYRKSAKELGCEFFDAADIAKVHHSDYVHLDKRSHLSLGKVLADFIY